MYNIKINLFIISVDLKTGKRYLLSESDQDISIPRLDFGNLPKDKLKPALVDYIRNIVPMHIFAIIPQIISLHSASLAKVYKSLNTDEYKESDIECVYGCLTDHIPPASDKFHWIEFNYEIPNDYSAPIFEVCQNLT